MFSRPTMRLDSQEIPLRIPPFPQIYSSVPSVFQVLTLPELLHPRRRFDAVVELHEQVLARFDQAVFPGGFFY